MELSPTSEIKPANPNSHGPVRILVIDDESGIRDLLSQELSLEGHKVVVACNGKEALEQIRSGQFQLALCDINMPDMSGLEVLEAIRQVQPEMEVLMMTGYGTVETAVSAMKKGAYDFIQKPFDLGEMLALVDKCLEKRGLRTLIQELREAKKKLEETQAQLVQSEKLASIGQLAAGVAHELNNPMSGIMGFTQLLLDDQTLTTLQRSDLETIFAQTQRCRTIIQNLLQFSRRQDPKMADIDVAQVLQQVADLIKYEFASSGISLDFQPPKNLPAVVGDPQQLQQVFLNLLVNARHALANRSISRVTMEASTENNEVVIRVADNGPGIPKNIIGKIFDPFFTTKPVGQGTGLGLSICHGIIEQHRGRIEVESEVNHGATFIVHLPIK
jgi:signal transduction histidine kinase